MKHTACSGDLLEMANHNAEVEMAAILKKVGFKTVEFVENSPSASVCA